MRPEAPAPVAAPQRAEPAEPTAPAPTPIDDTRLRQRLAREQKKLRALEAEASAPPPSDTSLRKHYATLGQNLDRAELGVQRADVNLRRLRGEASAQEKPSKRGRALVEAAEQLDKSRENRAKAKQAFESAHKDRPKLEKEMTQLSETLRFQGCRCVSDTQRGECRLESVETGRWRAKIQYLKTCAQDCSRWFADPQIRNGCASPAFLQKAQGDFAAKKKSYDAVIERERKSHEEFLAAERDSQSALTQLNEARRQVAGEVTPLEEAELSLPTPNPAMSFASSPPSRRR